ncbi:MAG: hypothetical protein H7343_10815 [Undibacterium sp.]|nr:hypothetical protein [Opitutaceae bacterium]
MLPTAGSRAAQSGASALPPLAQTGKPDAAGARALLERFRASGPSGDYYLEFELHALPRRGDEKVYRGKLWGARNDQGAITRVEVADAAGKIHRWLLQNGAAAAVWTRVAAGPAQPAPDNALLTPLIPGVELSAFDLLMPYLYWPDFELTRIERIRGRPAHTFIFRAPSSFAKSHPKFSSVRAYLDTQFNALMQAERLDANGQVLTTFSLGELKKIGEQWMIKSIDLRNEASRDKTRFLVTAVALGLDFGPTLFEPARLGEDVNPPRADLLVRLAP